MNHRNATGISWWKWKSGFEDEQVENKDDDDHQYYVNSTQIENVERYVYGAETWALTS